MPKTPEGKAKSAKNATKHGVLSNEPLLVNENPACYEDLLRAHIERFQPDDEVELEIVHEMAFSKWRQRRAWNNETAMIDMQMHEEQEILKAKFEKFDEATRIAHAVGTLSDESSKLRANSRYETRFHRMYYRAMNQLLELQDRRKRDTPPNDNNRGRSEPIPIESLTEQIAASPILTSPNAPTNAENRGHGGHKPNESSTGHPAASPILTSPNAPTNAENRGHSGHKPNESLKGHPAVSPIFSSPNAPTNAENRGRSERQPNESLTEQVAVSTTSSAPIENPPRPEKPGFPNELAAASAPWSAAPSRTRMGGDRRAT